MVHKALNDGAGFTGACRGSAAAAAAAGTAGAAGSLQGGSQQKVRSLCHAAASDASNSTASREAPAIETKTRVRGLRVALPSAGYAAESLLGNSRFRFLSTKLTRRCAGAVNRLPRSRRTSGSYSLSTAQSSGKCKEFKKRSCCRRGGMFTHVCAAVFRAIQS